MDRFNAMLNKRMNLKNLINELIELEDKDEPNFEKFDNAIDNWNGIILKINNMKNVCKNKIIFVGRCGSMKNELILYLIKLKLSQVSLSKIKNKYIEYISVNNNYGILVDDKTGPIEFKSVDLLDKYIQSNYSTFSSHIKIFYPRSENEILKDKIVMDTPFYNYSDEIDDEIVNNCKDGHIFIVVLNAVGSIGYRDKNFLKRISEINFIKLIFVFTCIEQVSKDNSDQTKCQHETNAISISNEILIPLQENIPIFFIEKCQMNNDDLQCLWSERNLKDYVDKTVQEIKQAKELITTKKKEIVETKNEKENKFSAYETQKKQNEINEKKNENIKKLQLTIDWIKKTENEIRERVEKSIDIHKILDYVIIYEITIKSRNKNLQALKVNKADRSEEQKNDGGKVSHCGEKTTVENKKKKNHKTANEETDEKERFGKNLVNQILEKIENRSCIDKKLKDDFVKFLNDYNKLIKQTSSDNENIKIKTKNRLYDNAKEEISKHIENMLQNIENIFKRDSPFIKMFKFSENMLKYLNDIWKDDSIENANVETSTLRELLDQLIKDIESVEIESFNVLLIFLLLIKILLEIIIEERETKFLKNTEITHTSKLNELKIISENIKLCDEIYQITFPKYEITKYSESDSYWKNSIMSQNKKLEILEKVETIFNEKLNEIIENNLN